ncbi:zinc finger CCHC domain-containing protein 3-like [Xenopus laevis]|uniref:Zinc finger CCHC domain-containing protein 3-like n=1 Tax=Xenopus laevis TaxID=8355 RepID=A0A8J0TE65_XENLA|nr:zinc finger CCHC domain-containing protein 3-like [Xenopus laevis]
MEEGVPAFARVKNSVRVVTEAAVGEERLIHIVDRILGEIGHVRREEILAIQDYPRRGVYDVTFIGEGVFSSFLKLLSENQEDSRLAGYRIFPHFEQEEVILIVKSYSPNVKLEEVQLVLSKFCEKLVFVGKVLNGLGIWTSKYRFKAKFKKDKLPPARFRLGTWSLDCFFNGMPGFCKKCRLYGHKEEACKVCRNCGETSHDSKDCKEPKKCNLCFQSGHLYANCLQRNGKIEKKAGKKENLFEDLFEEIPQSKVVEEEKSTAKSEVLVKRKTKVREETLVKTDSLVSVPETPAKKKPRTRGENLYRHWKDKTDEEIREYIAGWSDDEEFEEVHKCIQEGRVTGDYRERVLDFIRKLK